MLASLAKLIEICDMMYGTVWFKTKSLDSMWGWKGLAASVHVALIKHSNVNVRSKEAVHSQSKPKSAASEVEAADPDTGAAAYRTNRHELAARLETNLHYL
eukprot:3782052-Amphidinium_carterae.1